MNKSFSLVLAISVLSAMGYAQANLDNEVDAELNKMYSSQPAQTAKPVEAAKAADTASVTQGSAAPVSGQPIYILNQATPTATSQSTSAAAAVQKQPTTVIEASPLTESRAEALRKARQEAETSTEAKIVEKLEQSRLEDEKRRAQALFGDKLSAQQQQEAASAQEKQAAPVAPAVQPQIIIIPQQAPAPAVAPEKKAETATVTDKADEKADKEVKEAEKTEAALTSSVVMPPVGPVVKKYFSGSVGVPVVDGARMNGVNYLQGNYSLGFTFGNKYDDAFAVEGSFIYSNYEARNVNNYWYTGTPDVFDVNQYTGAFAGKWYLLSGMVKPVVGGLAQYSYREFLWSSKNFVKPNGLDKSDSHSVDVGALVGVEVEFSPTATVGLDARYMKNLVVRRNYATDNVSSNPYQNGVNQQWGYRTPVEDLDYYTISLSAKVSF